MLCDVALQERPNMGPYPAPLLHWWLNERTRENERERERERDKRRDGGRERVIKVIMFGSSKQQK